MKYSSWNCDFWLGLVIKDWLKYFFHPVCAVIQQVHHSPVIWHCGTGATSLIKHRCRNTQHQDSFGGVPISLTQHQNPPFLWSVAKISTLGWTMETQWKPTYNNLWIIETQWRLSNLFPWWKMKRRWREASDFKQSAQQANKQGLGLNFTGVWSVFCHVKLKLLSKCSVYIYAFYSGTLLYMNQPVNYAAPVNCNMLAHSFGLFSCRSVKVCTLVAKLQNKPTTNHICFPTPGYISKC